MWTIWGVADVFGEEYQIYIIKKWSSKLFWFVIYQVKQAPGREISQSWHQVSWILPEIKNFKAIVEKLSFLLPCGTVTKWILTENLMETKLNLLDIQRAGCAQSQSLMVFIVVLIGCAGSHSVCCCCSVLAYWLCWCVGCCSVLVCCVCVLLSLVCSSVGGTRRGKTMCWRS